MSQIENDRETIAILGGTGDLGTGLAIRWSKAGYRIIIGSRTLPKAERAGGEPACHQPGNAGGCRWRTLTPQRLATSWCSPCRRSISSRPSPGSRASLAGKILIDVTVPLVPPKVGTVQLPPEGSAGKRAQDLLGEEVMVVTAYQNVAAHLLQEDVQIECDVLIAGNRKAARDKVMQLTEEAGMTGWHAGADRELSRRRGASLPY